MTLLSSLVGMPRAPILTYGGWGFGPGPLRWSGKRPPMAVLTVNASALVTPATVANTIFMIGTSSRPGATAAYATRAITAGPIPVQHFPSHQARTEGVTPRKVWSAVWEDSLA